MQDRSKFEARPKHVRNTTKPRPNLSKKNRSACKVVFGCDATCSNSHAVGCKSVAAGVARNCLLWTREPHPKYPPTANSPVRPPHPGCGGRVARFGPACVSAKIVSLLDYVHPSVCLLQRSCPLPLPISTNHSNSRRPPPRDSPTRGKLTPRSQTYGFPARGGCGKQTRRTHRWRRALRAHRQVAQQWPAIQLRAPQTRLRRTSRESDKTSRSATRGSGALAEQLPLTRVLLRASAGFRLGALPARRRPPSLVVPPLHRSAPAATHNRAPRCAPVLAGPSKAPRPAAAEAEGSSARAREGGASRREETSDEQRQQQQQHDRHHQHHAK